MNHGSFFALLKDKITQPPLLQSNLDLHIHRQSKYGYRLAVITYVGATPSRPLLPVCLSDIALTGIKFSKNPPHPIFFEYKKPESDRAGYEIRYQEDSARSNPDRSVSQLWRRQSYAPVSRINRQSIGASCRPGWHTCPSCQRECLRP